MLKLWKKRSRVVRTPTIFQMEALECGAAALAIVLAHHGRWVPVAELREVCGVSRDGTSAVSLLRGARRYGLKAHGYKVELEQLQEVPPPLILHWNFNHFVVLEGFLRNGRIRINDPRTGPRTITREELDQALTGVVLIFEPGSEFEPGGRPPQLLRSLRRTLQGSEKALLFIVLASLALVVPGLAYPALTKIFVDHVLISGVDAWIVPLLSGLSLTALVYGALTWLQRSHLLRLETRLAIRGSSEFLWHILRLPMTFFDMRYAGDITYRTRLNDRIASLLSRDLAANILGAGLILFFAGVMLVYDVVLTLVSLTVVSLNFAVLRWVSRKRIDASRRLAQEEGKLAGTGLAGLQMVDSVKAMGSESDLFARWAGYQAKVIAVRQGLERTSQLLTVVPALLASVSTALVLGIGGLRVVEGKLTLGELVAFQVLAASFIDPVGRLVTLGGRVQEAAADVSRLEDALRYPAEAGTEAAPEQSPEEVRKLTGRLELRELSFGYDPLAQPLLEDLSFTIEPGRVVALVGRTGSGKSTVVKLVSGLRAPWSGELLLDGQPRAQLPRHRITSSVAVVDQQFFAFPGTVEENLRLWDETLPRERLVAAAEAACVHDEVAVRAQGYESPIEEGGANWSGGQLQRLEIARALAIDPTLVVLDEATSDLDPITERSVVENIRRRGCACLVVAHRLSAVREADEILVMETGRIVERGTHEELFGQQGLYAELIALE